MKLKFFLLVCLLIVLSGCKATYNLEIKNKSFKERISISTTNTNDNSIKYFKDNKFYAVMNGASSFVEYNKKISGNNVKFSHDYNDLDYNDSTVLKSCFKAYSIIKEGNYYNLSTSEGIKCAIEEDRLLLDDLDIVIKTNHVVKENNADEVHNHKYIWHFNKDNYSNKSINLKFYKDKYVFNYDNEFVIMISIICGIVLTILISVFIMLKKAKNANKI